MVGNRTIWEILSLSIGEYLNMRTDDFKKNIITSLSVGFSRVLAVLVITLLMFIVLGVFAFAFIVLVGEAIGSLSGAAFIVGGVYLIAAIVLILLRKRVFLNMFSTVDLVAALARMPMAGAVGRPCFAEDTVSHVGLSAALTFVPVVGLVL